MTVREASTMTLQEVVTNPAWLYELRKPTLLRICQLYVTPERRTAHRNMSLELLVAHVARLFLVDQYQPVPHDPDTLVTLLHDADFLQQITIHGLKLLCATQQVNINDNKDTIIRVFLNHIPLKITLVHGDWTKQVVVKRCNHFANFLYKEFFSARHLLMVDGLLATERCPNSHLGTLNINDGSVLTFLNTPDAPQDSSCKSLIDIEHYRTIESYRTIELLKRNRNNIDCRRARLHQQQWDQMNSRSS